MKQPLSIYFRAGRKKLERFAGKVQRKVVKHLKMSNQNVKPLREQRPLINADLLNSAFNELGLSDGDSVLVHSGISHLGKVIGGPKQVFELIQDMVGIHGNVLYPVFPFNSLMLTYLRSNPVFEVNNAPSKMGSLTEYALKVTGGLRSIHPTHSVLAFGENSEFFVGEHHLCETAFADQSPFARLAAYSGKILLIGVGLNSTTSFHRVEDRMGSAFPVKVYLDQAFSVPCYNQSGENILVKTYSHDPFVSSVRDCNLLRASFLELGVLKEIRLGDGTISMIDAAKMDECLEDLCRRQGLTIYGKLWGYSKV